MASQGRRVQPQSDLAGFPMMSTSELVDCLGALGISVQIEDIAKPTAQSAQMLYAALLDQLMAAHMDIIDQPKASLLGGMEYPELYSDALSFTMFFRHCKNLFHLCGVTNFSLADLTRPEAARLRGALSGVINFAKFRDERSAFDKGLQAKVQKQSEKVQKLQIRLEQIENDISDITAKNAADLPKTEEAKLKNEAIRNELLGLRSQQQKLSHEVEELKKERATVMEQASAKMHELTTLTASTAQAKSRIVQSPDRIKRYISDMATTVAREKATLAECQRKAREHGNRLEVISALELDLKGLIDLEKQVDEQRTKYEEGKRAQLALRAKLERMQVESQALSARTDQLDRQLQNANDRLKRHEETSRDAQVRDERRIAELKEEYVDKRKERAVMQQQRDRVLADLAGLQVQEDAFVAKHEEEMNAALGAYWNMRRQTEDYMSVLSSQLALDIKVV